MRPSNVGRLSGYRRDAAAHGGRRERRRTAPCVEDASRPPPLVLVESRRACRVTQAQYRRVAFIGHDRSTLDGVCGPRLTSCWAWPCNRASRPVAVGEAQPRTRCLARTRSPLLDRTCDSVTTTSVASHDEPPKSERKVHIQQDGKPWTKTTRMGKRAWATEGSGVADRTGILHSNPRW